MKNRAIGMILCSALMLGACGKSGSAGNAGQQTATVQLKDGGSFSGAVTKSDTSGITLQSSTGETRTYPMSQVGSVQYASGTPVSSTSNSSGAPNMAPAPPMETVRTLPASTTIQVRNSDTIRAGSSQVGRTFPGVVVKDVIGSDGGVAIPKGADAMLAVRASRGQGKVKGQSEIVIDLESVDVAGKHYELDTTDIAKKGRQGIGKNRRSAKFIGGGAVLGTVIGAVAGGPAGAAIGAGAGAGAGAGLQAITRGKAVRIPAETILSFRLEDSVEIRLTQ